MMTEWNGSMFLLLLLRCVSCNEKKKLNCFLFEEEENSRCYTPFCQSCYQLQQEEYEETEVEEYNELQQYRQQDEGIQFMDEPVDPINDGNDNEEGDESAVSPKPINLKIRSSVQQHKEKKRDNNSSKKNKKKKKQVEIMTETRTKKKRKRDNNDVSDKERKTKKKRKKAGEPAHWDLVGYNRKPKKGTHSRVECKRCTLELNRDGNKYKKHVCHDLACRFSSPRDNEDGLLVKCNLCFLIIGRDLASHHICQEEESQ